MARRNVIQTLRQVAPQPHQCKLIGLLSWCIMGVGLWLLWVG